MNEWATRGVPNRCTPHCHARRVKLVVGLLVLASACTPDVCGSVEIRAIDPETQHFDTDGDGDLDLVEFCGTSYGAFALDRPDYDLMIISFDASAPDNEISSDGTISRVVLPAAQIAILNKHLVPGTKLTMANIAGSGLHKTSAAAIYNVYPLTAATMEIISGPHEREDEVVIDEEHWSEEWEISWDLEFGDGVERWTGTDRIKRSDGDTIGTPTHLPPDYAR